MKGLRAILCEQHSFLSLVIEFYNIWYCFQAGKFEKCGPFFVLRSAFAAVISNFYGVLGDHVLTPFIILSSLTFVGFLQAAQSGNVALTARLPHSYVCKPFLPYLVKICILH